MTKLVFFLGLPLTLCGQIERPRLGMMLDANSAVRPVYGVAASSIAGEPVATDVTAITCGDVFCYAQSDGALLRLGPAAAVKIADLPDGLTKLLPDDQGALLYSPETNQIVRYNDTDGWIATPYTPSGELLSLRPTPDGFDAAIRREDGVWIEHVDTNGTAVTIAAIDVGENAVTAVLLLNDAYLIATAHSVALVRAQGTRQRFSVEGVHALFRMSSAYVEAVTDDGNWIICVQSGSESANLLPGVSAGVSE